MKNKRGAVMGDSMITITHVIMVTLVAFVVLGVSGMLYNYNINTRDSESMLVARSIIDCVAPEGLLNLDVMDEKAREDIFSFCGFNSQINDNVFASLEIKEEDISLDKIITGNEDLLWVKRIYTSDLKTDSIAKYKPGYFNGEFSLNVLKDGEISRRNVLLEVIVKYEK